AGVCIYLTAEDVVTESVDSGNRVAHSNLVEQRATGELQILLIIADHGLERVYAKQRVIVLVIESCALLADDAPVESSENGAYTPEITEGRTRNVSVYVVVHGIKAAGHIQNTSQRDLGARIRIRYRSSTGPPILERQRRIERQLAFSCCDTDQRGRNTL